MRLSVFVETDLCLLIAAVMFVWRVLRKKMESLWLLIFTTQSEINHFLRMYIIKQHGVAEARCTGPSGGQGYEAAPLSRCNRAIVDTLFPANLWLSSERGCHGNLLLPVAAAGSPSLTKLCTLPMIVDSRKRGRASPMNWIFSWSAEIEIALHHCYFSWRNVYWQESNLVVALGVLLHAGCTILFCLCSHTAWNIKNNNNRNSFWLIKALIVPWRAFIKYMSISNICSAVLCFQFFFKSICTFTL